jgi:hypothetical protein
MPGKPRLRHNARMVLFKQLGEDNSFKFYLTSRTYLNSLFAIEQGKCTDVLAPDTLYFVKLCLGFDLEKVVA